jgi:tRNA U34 5-carboxymethylaminomethyl modifying GTPase MnmE/TrmE
VYTKIKTLVLSPSIDGLDSEEQRAILDDIKAMKSHESEACESEGQETGQEGQENSPQVENQEEFKLISASKIHGLASLVTRLSENPNSDRNANLLTLIENLSHIKVIKRAERLNKRQAAAADSRTRRDTLCHISRARHCLVHISFLGHYKTETDAWATFFPLSWRVHEHS